MAKNKRQRLQNVNSPGAEAKGQPTRKKPKVKQAVQNKPRKVKTKRQQRVTKSVRKLTKISDVWENVTKEGEWVQSYHPDEDPTKSTRYVMLMFDDGWHISFYPKDPSSPSEAIYRNAAKDGFENEDNPNEDSTDDYNWREDYDMMNELEFDEFHVTWGKLYDGTYKHFFYKDDGTFIEEDGKNIDDNDRKHADELRLQIVPSASYYGAYKGTWPPGQQTLDGITHGRFPLLPSAAYLKKMKKIGENT